MMTSVAWVVPSYNAGRSVGRVIDGLRASLRTVVVIGIDDGSSDDTGAVLRDRCDRAITFEVNRGKGAALQVGFAAALDLGCEAVLTIDADGQHDPACAGRLVEGLTDADVVVGTRVRGGHMPVRRRITNALSAAAARRLGGCDVADPQSGFRALRASVIRSVRARGDRYEFETDFLIRAARAGFRIAAVPVPTIYGPPSHFREVRDGLRVVATFWRHACGTVA